MQDNISVSVIVVSFNHENYITKCIESIINQTYKDYELIVVDDGSTDRTREKLIDLQTKYHFNLILQENMGLSSTLTKTIRDVATGTYVTICSSDDYFDSSKIYRQVTFLKNNPQYPACFSKTYHVDGDSNILTHKYYQREEEMFKSGYIFEDIFLLYYTLPVTFMYKIELLKEIGYFSEKHYCEDYYIALKISYRYQIGYINEYLYYYRVNENSADKSKLIISSQKEIIENYKTHPLYERAITNWNYRRINELSRYKKQKCEFINNAFTKYYLKNWKNWKYIFRIILSWK